MTSGAFHGQIISLCQEFLARHPECEGGNDPPSVLTWDEERARFFAMRFVVGGIRCYHCGFRIPPGGYFTSRLDRRYHAPDCDHFWMIQDPDNDPFGPQTPGKDGWRRPYPKDYEKPPIPADVTLDAVPVWTLLDWDGAERMEK